MCRVGLLIAALVIGLSQARTVPKRSKQVKAYAYVLPAGAEAIRDDINHSFVCANRTDGFYVDIDNDCQIFHRCQDRARFSFICAEKTVFSQMYQTCVHEGQLGFPCEDSAMFFQDGEESSNSENEPSETTDNTKNSAVMPSQELMPPMAEPANDDEKVIGTAMMPLSDTFVNMYDHHQLNAETFDPIEEDESENTAQEELDEQPDAQASETVSQQVVEENENTQEIEVNDESKEDNGISKEDNDESMEDNDESKEDNDGLSSENEKNEENVQAVQDIPVEKVETNEIATEEKLHDDAPALVSVGDIEKEVQSELQNDVQVVDEPEAVVHNVQDTETQPDVAVPLAVEFTSNDIIKEEESQMVENNPSLSDTVKEQANVASPEVAINGEENVQEPILENAVAEIELNDDSGEESEQKLSEPLVMESPAGDRMDDSATPNESAVEGLIANADEHSSSVPVPSEEQVQAEVNQLHPLTAAFADQISEASRKINLPEFIVSTVADLRKGVPAPPLRRRKTFLFKADAIST